jgi:23S rRNA A1618 N6-methylase RlmF
MDTDNDGCDGYMNEVFVASSSRKRRHLDSSTNEGTSSDCDSSEISPTKSLEILERAQSPNFEELARQYPSFRAAWAATKSAQKDRGHAAFSSCVTQDFSIQLTRAILQALFRLKLPYLDEHHLCPPIPNRFFYLHWIQTKLMHVSWVGTPHDNVSKSRGLDIGSGASCIYSMLAARFFRTSMITSEIDPKSVGLARANVAANHLSSMITVLQVPPSHSQQEQQQPKNSSIGGPLQRSIEGLFNFHQQQNHCTNNTHSNSDLVLDFVMTNPPFYDPSSMEISTARAGDGRSRTNMTVSEGNYPGGEVGFVTEMIEDSLRMNSDETSGSITAAWYSSMLGKKTSLVKLQKLLVFLFGPAHVETTEYGPGHYTRWFLAWTLQQPPGTASGALCPDNDKDSFRVAMAEPSLPQIAVKEVANRIVAFCDSGPGGWDLTTTIHDASSTSVPTSNSTKSVSSGHGEVPAAIVVQITENMPPSISHFVDENQKGVEIPESILRVLRGRNNSQFLPDEGHFLVKAEIRAVAATIHHTMGADTHSLAVSAVDVRLSCYRHSARGAKAIEKIRNSLEGEVCQTNRKWRKIRERQNQQ